MMPRTLEFPHALLNYCIGAKGAIHAVARGIGLLAREYSLAEVAMAKSGLFRKRRAELRAVYLESQRDPELDVGREPSQPVRNAES